MAAINLSIASALNTIPTLATIRTVADIPSVCDMHVPPIEYILEDTIARNSLTIITGDAGSGKTTFVTAVAGAVSKGKEFVGLKTTESPVLYLDRENTAPVVLERLNRLGMRDGGNLRFYGGWLEGGPPPLDHPFYCDYVQNCNPKPMIIVDSLVAFHPGSENDSTETRKFLDQARKLTNLGAAVVMLHHTGKGEGSREYRGSSDIKGSADVAYVLSNSGKTRLEQIQLESFKSRFTTIFSLTMQYHDGNFTLINRDGNTIRLPHQEKLTELLQSHPGILGGDFDDLTQAYGIPRQEARNFLIMGVEEGRISQTSKGPRGKCYTLIDPPISSDMIM